MTTDGDAATYAEIKTVSCEAFKMDTNICYSNAYTSSNKENDEKRSSSKKQTRFSVAISVCVTVMMMVLVTTCACVIIALVQTASLQQRRNICENSTVTSPTYNSEELMLLRQTISSEVHKLRAELDRNSEQNNFSQFNSEMQELRAYYTDELMVLKNNFSQLNSALQELIAERDYNTEQLTELKQNFSQFHSDITTEIDYLRPGRSIHYPVTSCTDLLSPSDYYWVRASNGSAVRVYCDMTLSCGNINGGWMRVAELNMTDTSQQCPSNLVLRTDGNVRSCELDGVGCALIAYSTQNISYTKICGKVRAYQIGTTNAFRRYHESTDAITINSNYVDGVSLTHGTSPRQHIWTFAAALDRTGNFYARGSYCPCQNSTQALPAPPFVGEDYFCDAGNEEFMTGETGFQTDPLWDGTDCLCCVSDNPPWFYKQLPQPTTDNIEMRACKDEDSYENSNENISLEVVSIYIQ